MAKLAGADDVEKLRNLSQKTYKEQAVWFLNAYWDKTQNDAESFWKYSGKLASLDTIKGAEGCELDELNIHRFLEFFKETMTIKEMRDTLRDTGAVKDSKMKMFPFIHYLIFKYKVDFHFLVNASQGDNQKEIDEAQKLLDEVQTALQECEKKSAESKEALREAEIAAADANAREAEAKASEAEAKAREAEAKSSEAEAKKVEAHAKATEAKAKETEAEAKETEAQAKKTEAHAKETETKAKASEAEAKAKQDEAKQKENELRTAQDELEVALRDLKSQEDEKHRKTEELTGKSNDESLGVVTRNKFKAELAQHLAQDPLPLSKAKITQEAAVKKS